MDAYEFRHIVTFEDTDLLGNVNFVNYLSWQGRARELFLRDFASGVVAGFGGGVRLLTVNCGCTFLKELTVFDEVVVRMRLTELGQTQMVMGFEYWRQLPSGGEELVATGEQRCACVQPDATGRMVPARVPQEMRQILDLTKPAAGSPAWLRQGVHE
ncbi:acyl-CoA thioesterase [Yinghuangia seranimata]|uniref:acyl-CoA thioesterase n=1 Tax=Yinghuangia seranimata TaxID=408067 RepID=UPI00248B05B4|nr:acyl-CoA thioesterase [Yinghuangia seranimata]MDI2128459.1 acyl-CoA thioesterase [Yinghuangia seranimata]